jgi:pyridoxine 5'-phosphate synthase PdxJ
MPGIQTDGLSEVVSAFRSQGVRISVFVDARPSRFRWAASVRADRVELYRSRSRAFEAGEGSAADRLRRSWKQPSCSFARA